MTPMTQQEVDRWYKTVAWLNVRDYLIRKNPLCQHIDDDGKRCDQASRVVHHLISPLDRWDLRDVWSNLVAVCVRHHSGGTRGETQGTKYAPTYGPDPGYGASQEVYVHEVNYAGEVAKTGVGGKEFTSGINLSESDVDRICREALGDSTEEELLDLAKTSVARGFVYAMKHGQPFDRKMYPSPEELEYLKRCQAKYGDREGWNL